MESFGPLAIATEAGKLGLDVRFAQDLRLQGWGTLVGMESHWAERARLEPTLLAPMLALGSIWLNLSAICISEGREAGRVEDAARALDESRSQWMRAMELFAFSIGRPAIRLAAVNYNSSVLLVQTGDLPAARDHCHQIERTLALVPEKEQDHSFDVVTEAWRHQREMVGLPRYRIGRNGE